ncbi:MAG: protein-L-isoaspartate(D-aspartate) O-methyltransferase [Verrucomicrobia bacterium]|nr:protein-L-isoaspartate(D-aspartate) O-methyltransferase [Verrucomicrobiota bacterium]
MPATSGHRLYDAARQRMVQEQLYGLPLRVLAVMSEVPRHLFVPETAREWAYANIPVPIGYDQTISQPYIVGHMTAHLNPQPDHRVLEIGTGSGYQAAVLARLVADVYSIEIIEPLSQRAAAILQRLGSRNVHLRTGDGHRGWPEAAPFDAIIVTCAPEQHIPPPLIAQLKEGGRLIIPLGPPGDQELFSYQKRGPNLTERARLPVRFVPMTSPATQGS